jgi:hypothetical protein
MIAKISDNISGTIRYVRRDDERPANEKPYILHYNAPEGFPQNNFTIQSYPDITIRNLRTSPKITYEDNGIKLASLNKAVISRWSPEDFDDDDWIEREYLPELHDSLCKALGAEDVTIFDWMLRKRSSSFPKRNPGEDNEEAPQPSLSAHIGKISLTTSSTWEGSMFIDARADYTEAELEGRLDKYFGEGKEEMKKRKYQVIK